ncbi:MAG TPA: COX15/CtaA family protein [Anaerolineales bacterium]|nr:COX15/CtaA family protein [Anaerolineales bacterium]
MNLSRFAKFSWGVLFFNILVILWGAFVRATGSGAGCGSHWPLCNGEVVPQAPQVGTIIEFVHRTTSGLAFLLVLGLFVWAWRIYPKGDRVRRSAALSFLFIVTEALVGAGLVLFRWVAQDASTGRVITIVIHLVNTFLLLASLSMTAWFSSRFSERQGAGIKRFLPLFIIGLLGTILLGASGALTALGDTLFPAASFAEGFQSDFSPTAHFLIRLRVFHPTIAAIVGVYLIVLAGLIRIQVSQPVTQRIARWLTIGILLQLGAGIVNLFLLAPVWMQIVHLLLADLVWIVLILLTVSSQGLGYNSEL